MKNILFITLMAFSSMLFAQRNSIIFNANTTVESDEYQSIEAGDTIQLGFDFESHRLVVSGQEESVLFIEEILGFEQSIPGVQMTVWTNMSRWEIIYGFSNNRPMIVIEFPYIGLVNHRKYYWIKNKPANVNGVGGTKYHTTCDTCWWTKY